MTEQRDSSPDKTAAGGPAAHPTARVAALSADRPPHGVSGRWALGAVVLVAIFLGLPIRLLVAGRATMLSRDAVSFIWYAQEIGKQPLEAVRAHAQHPLYPTLVLAAHGGLERLTLLPASFRADPVRSWVVAAVGVSMVGGLAVIVACYAFTSRLFDRQTGIVAAVLAAATAEFCQLSADGLTDMPHLAVYLAALWAGLRGFQLGRYRWFLANGLLAGAGYLLRPEGAETAVIAVGLLAIPGLCRLRLRARLAAMVCVVVGAAAIASPYMIATGKLVQKKAVGRFFGAQACSGPVHLPPGGPRPDDATDGPPGDAARAGAATDSLRALGPIIENWVRSLRGTYLVPLAAWLVWRRRYPADPSGLRMVQAALGLHVAILVGLLVHFDYWRLFSLRHVVVLTGLSLPFAAAGVIAIVESVPERRQGLVAMLLGAGLIIPTLPWMLEVRHREESHYRAASAWIRANAPGRARVMTERYRMAFYAYGDYIPAPLKADPAEYLAWARTSRPEWLVFDERRILGESPGFFEELGRLTRAGEGLALCRIESCRTRRDTRRVLIYRYSPPRSATGPG